MVPVMAAGDPDARMTPAVRHLMREHGLSPMQIAGTGHAGRITREDVQAFVARGGGSATGRGAATAAGVATAGTPVVPPPVQQAPVLGVASHSPGLAPAAPSSSSPSVVWEPGQDEVLVPHSQMRKGIAAQMTRAAQIPVAHSTFEADMTAVVKLRGELADAYKAREGVGLSFLPFVVKAVVEALHGHPNLNAHYVEEGLLRKRPSSMTRISCPSTASIARSRISRLGPGPTSCASTISKAERSRSTIPAGSGRS
jgi:pyruvate/2-oxoglutarate dehydrogenase complex dihydrolipoamide acyltransferase (E2) component